MTPMSILLGWVASGLVAPAWMLWEIPRQLGELSSSQEEADQRLAADGSRRLMNLFETPAAIPFLFFCGAAAGPVGLLAVVFVKSKRLFR